MATDLVTCEYEASLQTAVVRMLENHVGSVIVERDDDPVGIVTETDALVAGAAAKVPFHEIPIEAVVSHPLITTTGDATIRSAVERMVDNDVKKLAVVDGIELQGILTVVDIATHHSELMREAREQLEQRDRWEARKADIDEF